MKTYKFRKLRSVMLISIFALIGAQVLNVASQTHASINSTTSKQNTCRSVRGLSPLLKRGNVLLFGEKHGTQEIPAFIADVVCAAAKKGIPVTLGLEIPTEEQAAIDRFLGSKGGAATKARLTEGSFWHPNLQDGRSSVAMLQLIDLVRALRASHNKVRILAYDSKPGTLSQERDLVMAKNLVAAIEREPKGLLVVLSGNIHTRLTRGNQWNKEFESMGYLLTKSINSSRLISLNASHEGGEAWVCIEESPDSKTVCKALRLKSETGAPSAWSVRLADEPNSPYKGTFGVGRITASPPVEQ